MNRHLIILYCIALIVGLGLASCSDDDQTQKYYSDMTEIFQKLKGDYSGYLTMPDNTTSVMRFSIADELSGSVTNTNVMVAEFPLEGMLAKLYPNDYHYVSVTGRDVYTAPIDSVGYQMNFMNFKTDDQHTAQINFSYNHNGDSHSGWAQVSTTGLFFSSTGLLRITFNVTDLAIDNEDMTRLLPISYSLDAEKR